MSPAWIEGGYDLANSFLRTDIRHEPSFLCICKVRCHKRHKCAGGDYTIGLRAYYGFLLHNYMIGTFNRDGYSVKKVNDAVYEAVAEEEFSGEAFWCVAGSYAQIDLKASPNAKVYVVRCFGPSETTDRRTAVQFTLDPQKAGVTPSEGTDDVNELSIGEHMAVDVARSHCER